MAGGMNMAEGLRCCIPRSIRTQSTAGSAPACACPHSGMRPKRQPTRPPLPLSSATPAQAARPARCPTCAAPHRPPHRPRTFSVPPRRTAPHLASSPLPLPLPAHARAGGNSRWLAKLCEGLPIFYDSPVERVSRSTRGVAIDAGGRRLLADAAVVTVPLGVLKKGGIAFHPPLSNRKHGAIERLGFGVLNKVS